MHDRHSLDAADCEGGLADTPPRRLTRRSSFDTGPGRRSGRSEMWPADSYTLHHKQFSQLSFPPAPSCCSRSFSGLAIRESALFRRVWGNIINVLLVYVGTIFIYRLAFVEFYVGTADKARSWWYSEDGWDGLDFLVNFCFWCDLVVNFLFTYRDSSLLEVTDMKRIAVHYLKTSFAVNFLSNCPPELIEAVFRFYMTSMPSSTNQALRLTRLKRVSRLARLVRITRLAKISTRSYRRRTINFLERHRIIRLLNLGIALLWIVHLLACGWYICAAMHANVSTTWVARRHEHFLNEAPGVHWATACYFVLTVFSTVGFGDITAQTRGEIAYVAILMIVGVVFHSILISEVVSVVTSTDKVSAFVRAETDLVECFADQTELSLVARESMTTWVRSSKNALFKEFASYSKSDMCKLINAKVMPHGMLESVSSSLFGGKLLNNKFLAGGGQPIPARLTMKVALNATKITCLREDMIYRAKEQACSIYLVLSGVFVHVTDAPVTRGSCLVGKPRQLITFGEYFGDLEIVAGIDRLAGVRCERQGECLGLARQNMMEIFEEYPTFHRAWVQEGSRRMQRFERSLVSAPHVSSYKELAVLRIQWWWATHKSGHRAPTTLPPGGWLKVASDLRRAQQKLRVGSNGGCACVKEVSADDLCTRVGHVEQHLSLLDTKLDMMADMMRVMIVQQSRLLEQGGPPTPRCDDSTPHPPCVLLTPLKPCETFCTLKSTAARRDLMPPQEFDVRTPGMTPPRLLLPGSPDDMNS